MSQSPSDLTAAYTTHVLNDPVKSDLSNQIIANIDNQLSDMDWVTANRQATDTTQSYRFKPFTLPFDKVHFTEGLESAVRLHYVKLGWTYVVIALDVTKLVSDTEHPSITINSNLTGSLQNE